MVQPYIRSMGNISPQVTTGEGGFLNEIIDHEGLFLQHQAPDYDRYVNPREARRMSHIVKMGVAAARICLEEAGCEMPDAILTSTGMGCIEDTERFLESINENEVNLVSPTAFIQSTHNTIGARIALVMGCNNYNFTYVHRGFSFESTLLDGMLHLSEGNAKQILVGGVDEITERHHAIQHSLGVYRKDPVKVSEVLSKPATGFIPGEGASFFLLTNEAHPDNYARIAGLRMLYKPSPDDVKKAADELISFAGLSQKGPDLVIYGHNGQVNCDEISEKIRTGFFPETPAAVFKHLSGEFHTASSFGLWLAAMILKKQEVPPGVRYGDLVPKKPIQSILMHNHFQGSNHSLILITP